MIIINSSICDCLTHKHMIHPHHLQGSYNLMLFHQHNQAKELNVYPHRN